MNAFSDAAHSLKARNSSSSSTISRPWIELARRERHSPSPV
jgi:hypothetical protein